VIESARPLLPDWASSYVPADPQELKGAASAWLRENAGQLRLVGQDVWWALVHIIVGMVIGAMIAVSHEAGETESGPLVQVLRERARLLGEAFRSVVFAQVRISALNTALTGLYLLGLVPLIGVQLPLTKTLIAVTFIAGLLPVIGNLISNTAIVVVSLSVSPVLAISSLLFLIAIHKLEYFVNAHVMGAQISARAWELLVAMLVMEAVFGIAGLVAAPIYYAYLKNELAARTHLICDRLREKRLWSALAAARPGPKGSVHSRPNPSGSAVDERVSLSVYLRQKPSPYRSCCGILIA
jgi:hypothetical protein